VLRIDAASYLLGVENRTVFGPKLDHVGERVLRSGRREHADLTIADT
jgi:hypothetical protein